MWIVGLNRHHNGSVCLIKDGDIVFHIEEERLSRKKYDSMPYHSLNKVLEYTDKIDHLVISGFLDNLSNAEVDNLDFYTSVLSKSLKSPFNYHYWNDNHHELHAACSFYNSGFDKSLCVVVDGAGSMFNDSPEIESIYYVEYPSKFTLLYKRTASLDYISSGWMFETISTHFGFGHLDAGKVMGMSSYGTENCNIPDLNNPSLFNITKRPFKFLNDKSEDFQYNADIAYSLQKHTQEKVLSLIKQAVSYSNCRNICLSGGYALNCVANYSYLQNLEDTINLYVEPISSDAGTSIGAAKKLWHSITNDCTIRKQTTLYYGGDHSIEISLNDNETLDSTSYNEVAELISKGSIVAMFQGKSESGPRSLGNRTILFDPRVENGKDIINTIKNREWFRPFAGTVLLEHVNSWFDMRGLRDSPFMMYAVNVNEDKKRLIPSIVHVDDTCRIQTVTEDQNFHYYNLIQEFNKLTNVPILFNTSFNLAGEPLVETLYDALDTFRRSKISYLYFPEKQLLLKNKYNI